MSEFTRKTVNLVIDRRIAETRKTAKENGIPVITDEALNLLSTLCRAKNPERILEIGTAVGASGAVMLLSANNARLVTLEKDEKSFNAALVNFAEWGLKDRVTAYLGDASETLKNVDGKFGFIFLDGAKSQYKNYLPFLVDKLEINGILFCDNVLFRGYVEGREQPPKRLKTIVNNLRIFIDMITSDERLNTSVLDIGDGVSVSVKVKDE